jgi:hypothetical protein
MPTRVSSSTSASRIWSKQASTHQSPRHFLHHRRSNAMVRWHPFTMLSSLDCVIRIRRKILKDLKREQVGAKREGKSYENDSDPIEFPLYDNIAKVSYSGQIKLSRPSSQMF